MKNSVRLLLLGLLIFSTKSCEKSEDAATIDTEAEILKEMNARGIPSVVACVVVGNEIAWETSLGNADVASSKPATRQSLYTIMSIGKLFLATAVMQLWEQGSIDLEADINQYLTFEVRNPNYSDKKITPKMLLTHTSGLAWPEDADAIPDFHHFYYLNEDPPLIKDWLPEYILPAGAQYRNTVWKNFAPGEQELYSNIGASLLGLIVEEISGQDYRDYCMENILDPLEMEHSAFRLQNLTEELLVTPYNGNNQPFGYYTSRHYPAGFLSSNIEDFSHFMMAILNKGTYGNQRILNPKSTDTMMELQNPGSGTSFLWVHCIGDCIGHLGGGTGFSTWAEWHMEKGSGLFIFSNKVNESIAPGGRIYELVRNQSEKY
jgi:CubicO group peptidase (beta-lactamase class C family)